MMTKTPNSVKTRSQKKAGKTRKKLKKAALDVFSEKTIDAATIEDITEKADVGKGTLYNYFDDKETIVVALIEESIEHLLEYIDSYASKPAGLEGMLEHLVDAHYEFSVNNREEFLLLFQGKLMVKLQSSPLEELEEPYLRYLTSLEDYISPYLSPKIDGIKVRRLACAVAGFVFGFFSFAMMGMNEKETKKSIRPLRRVFVKGLCEFLGG